MDYGALRCSCSVLGIGIGPVRLTPYSACSAYFFSRNGVFLSQQFSRNSVFSQFQPSFRPVNGAYIYDNYVCLCEKCHMNFRLPINRLLAV